MRRERSVQNLAAAALSTVTVAQPQPCGRRRLSLTCLHGGQSVSGAAGSVRESGRSRKR